MATADSILRLDDDLSLLSLRQAIHHSIDYLVTAPKQSFMIADKRITTDHALHALIAFQHLLEQHLPPAQFAEALKKQFIFLQDVDPQGLPTKILVTGYYQPVFKGNLEKEAPYLFPLYSPPKDLVIQTTSNGKQSIGRYKDDQFVPYWTRAEIDTMGKASGNELIWLQDPLDAFFLQIQGSGIIQLPDGTERSIHYATGNGHPYHSIGKYMVKTGRIKLETASMQTIRAYIEQHPEERTEILCTNPSYVFFHWSQNKGAIGNIGQELTSGRSIAVDQQFFPAGALGFLMTREPVLSGTEISGWKTVHRFVLIQDTGSAIKGSSRVDLYLGSGSRAGAKAGVMKETGKLYLLFLKKDVR